MDTDAWPQGAFLMEKFFSVFYYVELHVNLHNSYELFTMTVF